MSGKTRTIRELSLDKIAAVDFPCQEHATVAITKRSYTEEERQAMADKGEALKDGSYPIKTKTDLHNAVQAFGRAKDPAKVKAHIIARAEALDAVDAVPDEWGIGKALALRKEAIIAAADVPAAQGFAEILAANNARDEQWEAQTAMWPLFTALQDSLSSIAVDGILDPQAKISAAQDSVNQFIGALQAEWPSVAEEVAKIADASSNTAAMAMFKTAMKGKTMADTKDAEAKLGEVMKENDEMKAKIADMEAKAKKAADPDEAFEDQEGKPTKKGLAFIAKNAGGDDEILKNGDVTIKKSVVGESTFAFMKAQQADIQKARDEAEFTQFEKRAQTEFGSLPGTPASTAGILKALKDAPEDVRKAADAIFTAAEKMAKSAYTEMGTGGGLAVPTDVKKARADFMSEVEKIASRDKISKMKAMDKAEREHPELFKAFQEGEAPAAA